jgi:hypothetical protein
MNSTEIHRYCSVYFVRIIKVLSRINRQEIESIPMDCRSYMFNNKSTSNKSVLISIFDSALIVFAHQIVKHLDSVFRIGLLIVFNLREKQVG